MIKKTPSAMWVTGITSVYMIKKPQSIYNKAQSIYGKKL